MNMINILFVIISLCFTAYERDTVEPKSESEKELPPISGAPLAWGFDNAGYTPNAKLEAEVLKEFGFDLVVYHYHPKKSGNEFALKRLSDFYKEHNTNWILNLESANWRDAFSDDKGRDWYNHADGRHYFMFPDEVLESLSTLSHKPGIMYDEAGHMQNSRNYKVNKAFFLKEGDVQSLEDASGAFTEKAREIAEKYQNYDLEVYSEHVFPVQFHTLADAGFIPVSKVLKENNIPAFIACALGAAIQYDKPFWLTPDLWNVGGYPGHSAEEYKSSLLMAYHMGAEGIYTENLGFDGSGSGKGKGSLIKVDADGNGYKTTEWGDVTKWFRWEYAPENPRNYSYKDLIPKVAIIRQEDACWGQSDSFLEDELFGMEGWNSTPTTEAWLEMWNLLSNGQINSTSISWHNNKVKAETPYQVFYPLDGVVVFDEKVGGEHLSDVELIFLTGIGISKATLNDVRDKVKQGAVCVSLPGLAPTEILNRTGNNGSVTDGQGKWIISESFLSDEVKDGVQPFLPQEDYIRYQFGNTEVQFRPLGGDKNKIEVQLK